MKKPECHSHPAILILKLIQYNKDITKAQRKCNFKCKCKRLSILLCCIVECDLGKQLGTGHKAVRDEVGL